MSSEAKQYWKAGQAAINKGEMQQGLSLLQKSTQADPGFAQGWLSLGLGMSRVGQHDKAAYFFAIAAANSEDHESVGPVTKTNLDAVCKQWDLWPSELRSRMTDSSYGKWLNNLVPPTSDNTLNVMLESVGSDSHLIQHKIDVISTRSTIMQFIEQNLHAMNSTDDSNDEIAFTTEVPSNTTIAILGYGLFPMLERTLLKKCLNKVPDTAKIIPSGIELHCCLVESKELWELNQVDTAKLENDSNIDASPLQGRLTRPNRPVQRHAVEHTLLSKPVKLSSSSIRKTEAIHINDTISVTEPGSCVGLLVWECLTHDGSSFDAGGFTDETAITHKWQFILYSKEQFNVSVGDKISVSVHIEEELKSRASFSLNENNLQEQDDHIIEGTEKLLPPYHASMLGDTERTLVYKTGLKHILQESNSELKLQNKPIMDLGSGTGLLSIMASIVGFKNVFAVERFEEMTKIADDVIKSNKSKLTGSITTINKHSSDITIPTDMPEPASVLVHEIFGTDPLSEGLISAFNACIKANLFTEKTIFCPSKFRVIACCGNSDSLRRIAGCNDVGSDVQIPPFVTPRKLEQKLENFSDVSFFTEPVVVWDHEFSYKGIPTSGSRKISFPLKDCVVADSTPLVFYWFDFTCGESVYSTRHSSNHWVQNIEILPEPIPLNQQTKSFDLTMQWMTDRVMFLPQPV